MKKAQTFKGFETWWNMVRMQIKMYLYLFLFFLFLHVSLFLALSIVAHGETLKGWIQYAYLSFTVQAWGNFTVIKRALGQLLSASFIYFVIAGLVWLIFPTALGLLRRRAKEQQEAKYISGARLMPAKDLNREIRRSGEATSIQIGDVKMPVSAEVKHALIIGRPGVGKTVLLSQVIENLKERKAKGIIYDFKGDYLAKFYDPSVDLIFNPLDSRGMKWNLFNEVVTYMDIDAIAASLIPPSVNNTDPFWHDAARGVLSGALHYLYRSGNRDVPAIWQFISSPIGVIAEKIKDIYPAGYSYIQDTSSRQAMSVISVMMQYAHCFQYMPSAEESDFSVRRWLNNEQQGFIFVTNYADIQDTLRPILSLFVDLLGRKLLSSSDNYNRRVFFILDEFGTLQRLPTIKNLLTLSRSKGGSCWLGIQDIGQIEKIYGREHRQAIVNSCATNAIFSVNDPDTARFLSQKIGQTKYSQVDETLSMGAADNRDGISLIRRDKTEDLFLPSDLMNLPDLELLLKLPNYHITQTKLHYKNYRSNNASFILREGLSIEELLMSSREQEDRARQTEYVLQRGNKRGQRKDEVDIQHEQDIEFHD